MKPHLYVCLLALPLSLCAQGTPEAPVVTASGPHTSTWSWTETAWDELGRPVTNEHSYIETATGLNFFSPDSQQYDARCRRSNPRAKALSWRGEANTG